MNDNNEDLEGLGAVIGFLIGMIFIYGIISVICNFNILWIVDLAKLIFKSN
jgi:hypothetical protein